MELHHIDLNSQYRLYAFATYQDMAAAKADLKHVVLAKAFEKIREIEAKNFVRRIGQGGGFQNYLEANTANPKRTALASIVTALQALYKHNCQVSSLGRAKCLYSFVYLSHQPAQGFTPAGESAKFQRQNNSSPYLLIDNF